jgi:transcriptional regulator
MRTDGEYSAHLQGTLDLLILRTLIFGRQHGQGIARAIQAQSDNVLIVEHGSLYPALQRLEERGFIAADWGTSENNRKARFYTLTRAGRKARARPGLASRRRMIIACSDRVETANIRPLHKASHHRVPSARDQREAAARRLV